MQTTGDVTKQFGVSRTTVSNWCHEFSRFLSPTANPPVGSQRRFTDGDLQVLALIYRQKRTGLTFEEIAAALASGERDEPPMDIATTTNVALERLQQRIVFLENQLRDTERQSNEQLTKANTRADRAEGAVAAIHDMHAAEVERLEKRLTETQAALLQSREEIARLKAEG